jgi:dipeptidase D
MNTLPEVSEALQGLEPISLWRYFHALTQIPRASGNEQAAMAYMAAWAEENGFKWTKDGANLCIKVPATKGYENRPAICLQGHIDMVPAKTPDKIHDFAKDPIKTIRDVDKNGEEVIRADQTTLGADNGIGLAGAMAIATDPEAIHGPLELLITSDEEKGLSGIFQLDLKKLEMTSSTLINLDNEQLGETGIQSAGLKTITGTRQIDRESSAPAQKGSYYKLTITDLPGGHSAKNIADGIPNAIKAMAAVLKPLETSMRLVSITGGERENGIPITCEAVAFVPEDQEVAFATQNIERDAMAIIKGHGGKIKIEQLNPEEATCTTMTEQTHSAILSVLADVYSGVDKKHPDFNMPFTSRNLGTVRTGATDVKVEVSMRSPAATEIERVDAEISGILNQNGFTITTNFQLPAWNADPKSSLVAAVNQAYKDVTGKTAILGGTHGALEPSMITQELSNHLGGIPIESVAFGPEIHRPHSPSEDVNIKSVEVFYKQLKRTLELQATQPN